MRLTSGSLIAPFQTRSATFKQFTYTLLSNAKNGDHGERQCVKTSINHYTAVNRRILIL